MPTYQFRNKETGEVFDKMMKISEREKFLQEHPELEICVTAPFMGPIYSGAKKPDDGFKDVLRNIQQKAIGGRHLQSEYI